MVLAEAHTTASTGAIWVIIIVATVALAFWLVAINLADRSQVRASGPAPAPARDEPAPAGETPTRADLPAQRTGDADRAARSYAARDDEEPGR